MRPATPVTTSIIIRLSGSSRSPNSIRKSPASSHVQAVSRIAGVQPAQETQMTDKTNAPTTAPMERPALSLRSARVNKAMTTAAASGRNRMNQGSAIMKSQLHRGQVFHVGRAALAIEGHDERQTHRHLGGRHGDDEKHEHLPIEIAGEAREGDHGQRGRVEHQLERHVNHQQIAPHDHPHQPQAKEDDADGQIMFEANSHFRSFLLSNTTPTIATSNSTDTTSKGSRNWVNSPLPSGSVPPSGGSTEGPATGDWAGLTPQMAAKAPH